MCGKQQRGVQLHHLGEAVTTWNERYSQRAWVRQLIGTIERHHEDRLMEIIDRFDGRAFPTTLGLIRQWIRGRIRRTSSLETIYCAELIATTYQQWGCSRGIDQPAGMTPEVLERRSPDARPPVRARPRDRDARIDNRPAWLAESREAVQIGALLGPLRQTRELSCSVRAGGKERIRYVRA